MATVWPQAHRFAPYVLRRRKEEVLPQLPPLVEQTRYVTLTDRQASTPRSPATRCAKPAPGSSGCRLAKKGADDAHSLAHRPLTEHEISAAEMRLGFDIPSVLTTLYARVANGGFGPSYGLLGLVGGARQEDGNDAITMYEQFRQHDPNDRHWQWPEKVLPIVHLGCAMFFCVDWLFRRRDGYLVRAESA